MGFFEINRYKVELLSKSILVIDKNTSIDFKLASTGAHKDLVDLVNLLAKRRSGIAACEDDERLWRSDEGVKVRRGAIEAMKRHQIRNFISHPVRKSGNLRGGWCISKLKVLEVALACEIHLHMQQRGKELCHVLVVSKPPATRIH